MSITLESAEKLNTLKRGIEATTGESYPDLTAGVQALKDGFGKSESPVIGKPYIDTSRITDFRNFCAYNRLIDQLTRLDTSNGTNFSYMFTDSRALQTIPQIDTSKGTTFEEMFYGCSNLTSIPQLDTSKGTNFNSMFQLCSLLTTIPQLDTSKGEFFSNMFQLCSLLTTIPQLDTSKGTSFSSMFHSCTQLKTIPQLDISNGTGFYSMFRNCPQLETVSITKAKSNFQVDSFQGCTALKNITIGEGWNVNIYLHYSENLTTESLHGMIENLADLTGQTAKTFQIGATNIAKIDEEHLTMLQNKNWNYS